MKKVYLLSFLFGAFLFSSCADTVVIENRPDESANAPAISGYFKKRVLIEDYTGTWCGNCARVAYAIDQVKLQTDKAVTVAIHNGNDPYHFNGIAPLKDLILPNNALSLPISRLNRMIVWTFPEPTNTQQALDLTGNNTSLGLALTSTVVNGTINLDVKMKFLQDYTNLKLVVYLLEDKLIYDQRNYTNYFNGENPIINFEHNHVLRTSITNILGDVVFGTTNGSTVTKNFTIPIPANIANSANISFAAFLVGSDNVVLNARASIANENQIFELNP
ncbi:Omp28-related outer membrane protein [Flavobacterium sp.]|jgi:hypothetical protein|uniref:Omp28-related outer membrane protein n=1 Tax=Flavobacterium sp. TaxID=239 RepID=UPI0037BF6BBD